MEKEKILKRIKPEWAILFVIFCVLVVMMVPVDFTGDRGDGIYHYLISKTALTQPAQYLDLWNKPLFTLIASPFAQFGFPGMHFFNICCYTLSALMGCSIARKFNLKFAWLFPFILLFSPVYFDEICTAMTEPFFALVTTFVIYLFLDKKFASAAFFCSLLPFARQEGYLLIPVMIILYVFFKQYKLIPLFFSGFLILSTIGYFYFDDFFWLIHNDPYGQSGGYGHGELFHFVKKTEKMLGLPLQVVFYIGALFLLSRFAKIKFNNVPDQKSISGSTLVTEMRLASGLEFVTEFYLVFGYTFIFFAAHSIMWWQGILGSLGLERVIACVTPLIALVVLRGINIISDFVSKYVWKKIHLVFVPVFVLLIFWVLYSKTNFPPILNDQEREIKKAGTWIKQKGLNNRKIYYGHPYNIIVLKINPKKRLDSDELMYTGGTQNITPGGIVIWDAEYCPTQQGFPLEAFTKDSTFRLLNRIKPDQPFNAYNGLNFEVMIFEKLKPK